MIERYLDFNLLQNTDTALTGFFAEACFQLLLSFKLNMKSLVLSIKKKRSLRPPFLHDLKKQMLY